MFSFLAIIEQNMQVEVSILHLQVDEKRVKPESMNETLDNRSMKLIQNL